MPTFREPVYAKNDTVFPTSKDVHDFDFQELIKNASWMHSMFLKLSCHLVMTTNKETISTVELVS